MYPEQVRNAILARLWDEAVRTNKCFMIMSCPVDKLWYFNALDGGYIPYMAIMKIYGDGRIRYYDKRYKPGTDPNLPQVWRTTKRNG